jgi:hypothetical protein
MRRAVFFALSTALLLAAGSVSRAEHKAVADLRAQVETATALLDSHTRRLYYEVRDRADGDDDQAQLLSDARELWRAARRINDRAMDGAPASRLEREVRDLEDAFHAARDQFEQLRQERVSVAPVSKRLKRIDDLVHAAHDGIHDLLDKEKAVQGAGVNPQRPSTSRTTNPGHRTAEPLPRVQETERRAADYVDPPAIRVGPDGFYFDGRRFTIPLGR